MKREAEPSLWRSLDERDGALTPPDLERAIREQLSGGGEEVAGPTRRSFLRAAGFSAAAAGVGACARGPELEAIPYLDPPQQLVPGRSYWIASTCGVCPAGCGLLAKGRDGRPIKLEGNPEHPVSRGGLCARGQADLLGLYDQRRYDGPRREGGQATWAEVDAAVVAALAAAAGSGGGIRLLTATLTSPSTRERIARLLERYPGARHVEYDALSTSALLEAHRRTRGAWVLPRLRFDRAECIVSFDADFLGTWYSPVEHAASYRAGRDPEGSPARMSRHWQLEPRLSLTGSCADHRVTMAPWELGSTLGGVLRRLAELAGETLPADLASAEVGELAARLADELWRSRGAALVVCGVNDVALQLLTAWSNELLGAYGTTLELDRPSLQRRGDDRALEQLRGELEAGAVEVLVVAGCNPAYDLPDPEGFAAALRGVATVVCCAQAPDETSALADLVLPEPHPLERWDDSEAVAGVYGLRQPTVPPLRAGRTLRATLARWLGDGAEEAELVRDYFARVVHPASGSSESFDLFFHRALERGFVEVPLASVEPAPFAAPDLAPPNAAPPPAGALRLVLHPEVAIGDGSSAHNPWLQELPDPVTKVVWDNYAALSPATAAALGAVQGDEVEVTPVDGGGGVLRLPVYLLPGQDDGVVAVALGYGRAGTDRFAPIAPRWLQGVPTVTPGATIGVNAAPLLELADGCLRYDTREVRVTMTGSRRELACTQDHHRLEVPPHLAPARGAVREAVRATTLERLRHDPAHAVGHESHAVTEGELWADDHARPGPRWGLVVDLAACTGCSACVVSCQAENNVPVVGRDEVRRHREMHWLRIDRYFQEDEGEVRAWHQPMMCQHCDHAPCETVCPVLATVHSAEGVNQQVYNRCVGTRYCANNCPYKVRRFNWFDYSHEEPLENMALNPEVTVRSRGVMEKCSLCYQRVLDARIEARRLGRPLRDGDIQTACQQSCPTSAIVFGDLADPGSRASRAASRARSYRVLGELNVQPSVCYLAAVRNPGADGGEEDHA